MLQIKWFKNQVVGGEKSKNTQNSKRYFFIIILGKGFPESPKIIEISYEQN